MTNHVGSSLKVCPVLTIAGLVITLLLWKVVPIFVTLFNGLEVDLPLPTRAKAGVVVAVNTGEGPLWPEAPQAGDVIYALNKELVASVAGLRTAAAKLKPGDPVVLLVERQGELLYLAAELE